jgi:hypothetical protein
MKPTVGRCDHLTDVTLPNVLSRQISLNSLQSSQPVSQMSALYCVIVCTKIL